MRISIQDWDPTALQPLRHLVVDNDDAVRDVFMQQLLPDGHFTETAPVAMSMLLWANRWRARRARRVCKSKRRKRQTHRERVNQ
jgi:hypothetical protein